MMEMEQWKQPSVPSFQRLEDTEAVPDVHSVDVGLPNVSVKLEKEEDDLWESNHQCSEENKAFPDAHSGLPVATMKMDEPWEPKALEEIENIVDQCSEFLEGMTDVKGEEESWIHQAVEENNTFPSTCSEFSEGMTDVKDEEESWDQQAVQENMTVPRACSEFPEGMTEVKDEEDSWDHQSMEENKTVPGACSGFPVATMKIEEPWEHETLWEFENIADQCSEFPEGMTEVKDEEESWDHQVVEENKTVPSACSEFPDVKVKLEEEDDSLESDVQDDEEEFSDVKVKLEEDDDTLESDVQDYEEEMDPNTSNPGPKQKRRSYEAGFKLNVVSRAEESNNSIASREFCVDEKLVRDWRKMKADLEKIPKAKKARRGSTTSYGALETELYKWIMECCQNGSCVTRMGIRSRARQMAKDDKFKAPGIENFGASAGWCTRFMNRFALCLRQRTNISQKFPKDLDENMMSFHSFFIKQRRIHNYDLGDIGNMDETSMTFDLPSNRTVASLGDKTILLRTTGNDFTVVLSYLANGTKLRPVIIFKRKTLPKKVKFPPRITVRAHIKGWLDEDGTKKWLEEIWNRRPGAALMKKPSLLVWDMFRAHTSDDIKKLAKSSQVTLAIIPGGLTSVFQPLDVCINKPFKDRVQKKWHEWMSSGPAQSTKVGNLMKPDIELIAKWVRDAWEEIPEEIVQRAFKKCGISNSMDGSEDSALYENDSSDGDDCKFSDDDNVYADNLTPAIAEALFGHTDEEEESSFEGF